MRHTAISPPSSERGVELDDVGVAIDADDPESDPAEWEVHEMIACCVRSGSLTH